MEKHTDIFTSVTPVDLVLVQLFDSLPEFARRYITMKAARRFASRFIGDKEITQLIAQDEQEAYISFVQADTRSADHNILDGDYNTYNIANRTPRRTY